MAKAKNGNVGGVFLLLGGVGAVGVWLWRRMKANGTAPAPSKIPSFTNRG